MAFSLRLAGTTQTTTWLEQIGPCELDCIIIEIHIFQASLTLIDQDLSTVAYS